MTQDEIKALKLEALIEDLRLNHECCPKEVILQAADELERLSQRTEQEPVAWEQFYPDIGKPQLEQELVVGTKTWFEDGKVVSQHLTASEIYKKPDEEEYLYKAYRLANELQCHLATAPTPQRTWVGLTDEEIWETISRIGTSDSDVNPYAKLADARAIEAKLKEKNT
jgi:hypothetical protein